MQTITLNKAWSAAESVATPVVKPFRKVWLASLGAASLTRKEASKVFEKLIEEGTKFESKSRKALERKRDEAEREISNAREQVTKAAEKSVDRIANKAKNAVEKIVEPAFYHLVPKDDDWAVRREGHDTDLSVHRTKQSALDAARGIAQAHEPSHLVVHRADGTVQATYTYEEKS